MFDDKQFIINSCSSASFSNFILSIQDISSSCMFTFDFCLSYNVWYFLYTKSKLKLYIFCLAFSLSECISVYIVMLLLKQSDHFFYFSVVSAAVLIYRCQSPCLSLCHIKPVCVLVFTQYLQRHWNFYYQLLEQEISFILLSRN